MRETFMTRTDDHVGEGIFDSIQWLFETHIKETDTGEFNFAILFGNEDAPEKVQLWREEPNVDTLPDREIWL